MSFEIKTIEVFDRQAKRLAKHYASFKQDYKDFLDELRKNPLTGTDLGGTLKAAEAYGLRMRRHTLTKVRERYN